MRIQHVNVVVPPGTVDAALTFYVEVLGLHQVEKLASGTGGAWLAVDDANTQQVHLSERSGETHADAHFALVVDDFDEVLDRIAVAGASFTEQEDVFGGRRGFTRDPAGNRIELLERIGLLS